IFVFLDDFEVSNRRLEAFATAGNHRNAHEFAALVKIRALLTEADLDRGSAVDVVAIPVGDVVEIGPLRLRLLVIAAQLDGTLAVARIVVGATRDKESGEEQKS